MECLVDPHIHIDSLGWNDLELMSMCGIKAVISHPYYPYRAGISSQDILRLWDRLLTHELWRCETNGIELYIAVGVHAVSAAKDPEKIIEKLPHYLKNDRVVAIGEIGIDPRSTVPTVKRQEELVYEQLKIAKNYEVPVIIHAPRPVMNPQDFPSHYVCNKPYSQEEIIRHVIDIAKEVCIPMNLLMVDHLGHNAAIIELVREAGAWVGLTVKPLILSAPDAAKVVQLLGPKGIMIDSDAASSPSDPISVARTLLEMRKLKIDEAVIREVSENPRKFLKLKV